MLHNAAMTPVSQIRSDHVKGKMGLHRHTVIMDTPYAGLLCCLKYLNAPDFLPILQNNTVILSTFSLAPSRRQRCLCLQAFGALR